MYIDVKLEAIMPRVCHIFVCTVLMQSSPVGGFLAIYRLCTANKLLRKLFKFIFLKTFKALKGIQCRSVNV